MHLERSCVPIGAQFSVIDIPAYVLDIFVIEGYVQDYVTGNMFIAPALVSRACTKLICNVDNFKTINRILLITQDNIPATSGDELSRCIIASYNCRRGTPTKDSEGDESKGFMMHLNFNTRQKKRRRSTYVEDDDKNTKDETIRRRVTPNAAPRRPNPGDGDDSTLI
ncbi:uncharacterized protein LOC118436559 [Folsomia candida]|uniref:uncharacterized protein LOC118436559 n=1 Tax=Folsomia candida TaxID=158441 RepID=UPI00160505FE|nr:uncharacterized protein LOC118436559 [Folsomia candida]